MTYKMVTDRVDLARRLETLIETHAETVARPMAALFASLSEHPEELWFQGELACQRALARYVARLRREMVAAADTHGAAIRELDALLAEQNEAVRELYGELVDVRREARELYGSEAAVILGVAGRTDRNPTPLAEQARTARTSLSWPVAAGTSLGLAAHRRAWSQRLTPPLARLDRALADVTAGKATTILTLGDKRAAMEEFDDRFGRVGRYVKVAYELVRLDDLAAQVPPRTPRKSRRKTTAGRAATSRAATGRTQRAEGPAGELRAAFGKLLEMGRRMSGRLGLGAGWRPRRA